jgi:hypothetical protein
MKTLARNESGRFVRDDTQLASALIETLGIVKRGLCAWELFPDLTAEERRTMFDGLYGEITALVDQLHQVDTRKGGE